MPGVSTMTTRQKVVQRPDGTSKVLRAKPKPVRPTPQPCPECEQLMSVVDEPQPHYECDSDHGCGITRDINPDTGLMTDRPFDPSYIGDIVVEFD